MNKINKNGEVLIIESIKSFDNTMAWRIAYQDEEVLKRGKFIDEEIGVKSFLYPQFSKDFLYLKGKNNEHDDVVAICTIEEEKEIQRIVKLINEKYGKKKLTAEEYYKQIPAVPFVPGEYNFYIVYSHDDKSYSIGNYCFCEIFGMKCISKEDAKRFCEIYNK